MNGDDFVGHLPNNPFRSSESQTIFFNWNPNKAMSDSIYSYNLKNMKISQLDFDSAYQLASPNVTFNTNRTKKLYEKEGDIFLVDTQTNKTIRVTTTKEIETNPHFTANDSQVAYIKGDNLFLWDSSTGSIVQLTYFTDEKEASEDKRSTKDEWMYNDFKRRFTYVVRNNL